MFKKVGYIHTFLTFLRLFFTQRDVIRGVFLISAVDSGSVGCGVASSPTPLPQHSPHLLQQPNPWPLRLHQTWTHHYLILENKQMWSKIVCKMYKHPTYFFIYPKRKKKWLDLISRSTHSFINKTYFLLFPVFFL